MPILVLAQIKLAYIYTSYQWDVKGGAPKRRKTNIRNNWRGRWDSNPYTTVLETATLPLRYSPLYVVGNTGLEPVTP